MPPSLTFAAPCSGDYWRYYRDLAALVSTIGPDRALLTFYETLQTDFESEVRRLADFLGIPLTATKLEKLAKFVAFDNMSSRGILTTRKGVTRDFENHLDEERWAQVDRAFHERMGGVAAFAPLAPYM